jgi:hypothetical protein
MARPSAVKALKKKPRRNKEYGSHRENSTTGTNVHWEKANKKWGAALTVSVSSKILLLCYRSQNETYVKKNFEKKKKCCST